MKTIWKYPFPVTDDFYLSMPKGSEPLTVQVQRGQPCMWALVEDGNPAEQRHFRIYGTGHWLSENEIMRYLGTFQIEQPGGLFVGHLFEVER